MRDNCILTIEPVTEGHPDKLRNISASNILDACGLRKRVAPSGR